MFYKEPDKRVGDLYWQQLSMWDVCRADVSKRGLSASCQDGQIGKIRQTAQGDCRQSSPYGLLELRFCLDDVEK